MTNDNDEKPTSVLLPPLDTPTPSDTVADSPAAAKAPSAPAGPSLKQVAQRALGAVKRAPDIKSKIRGVGLGVLAVAKHLAGRINALPMAAKIGIGAGIALVGFALATGFLLSSGDDLLRNKIRAQIKSKDFLAAYANLQVLQGDGELSEDDTELAKPVEKWLRAQTVKFKTRAVNQRKKKNWDKALAALDRLDELGQEAAWSTFTRAEVLRDAQRIEEAKKMYATYFSTYPQGKLADAALFWMAHSMRELGERKTGDQMLEKLIENYPDSGFVKPAKRLLAEGDEPPPVKKKKKTAKKRRRK